MDKLLELYHLQEEEGFLLYWTKEIVVALLILAFFWALSRLVQRVLVRWGRRFTSDDDLRARILERVTPLISLFVLMEGVHFAVRSLPEPEKVEAVAAGIVFIINVVIVVVIAYRMAGETLNWYAARHDGKGGPLNRQLLPLLEKLVSIFLGGSALIITLKHFGYDILSLVTALGIGSLAIGMAAKDTLANMISGFTLMIDRPFRIGDRIQLTGGQMGDVVDIGLRSTRIQTPDHMLLIIPNSDLCNSTVVNMNFPDVRGKGKVEICVVYGSDVDEVKRVMIEAALEVPEVLREPPPGAFFVTFGDCGLHMSLFFWVEDYTRAFPATDKVNSLLLKRLRERRIQLSYPTRTVLLEQTGTNQQHP